jgi:hypothetical protein
LPSSPFPSSYPSYSSGDYLSHRLGLSLTHCRYVQLRRRGRPFSHMFSRAPARPTSPSSRPFRHTYRHTASGAPDVILPSQPLHAAIHSDALFTIPTLPVQGRGRRAVRGADTDAQGRREGPVDPDDHEEGIEKEILPAYDAGQKGPPRYADVMYGFNPFRRGAGQPGGGGEHVELSQLGIPDRHPADRPLGGDPFEDGSHGGLTQITTRDSRELERSPTTPGSRPASRNENEASAEPPSVTMPEPHPHPAPSYSPPPSTEVSFLSSTIQGTNATFLNQHNR